MGTNYYLRTNICECCNRYDERHIGKSSSGWHFSLRIYQYDDVSIQSLADWQEEWKKGKIYNEYGHEVTPSEMLKNITERSWNTSCVPCSDTCEPGLNNLLRHKIDGQHCVGHGEGTWDYFVGDFC